MCCAPPTVLDIIAIVAMISLHRKATADTAAICPRRFNQPGKPDSRAVGGEGTRAAQLSAARDFV